MIDDKRKDIIVALAKPIVKHFEGLVLNAYKDPVGIWTIGYGHTSLVGFPIVTPDMKISETQAEKILEQDLRKFLEQIIDVIPNHVLEKLNDNQLAALLSFSYNVGVGNLKKSTLLKKISRMDFDGAAREFDRWVYAGGKKLRGLVRRRKREKELFLMPQSQSYNNSFEAETYSEFVNNIETKREAKKQGKTEGEIENEDKESANVIIGEVNVPADSKSIIRKIVEILIGLLAAAAATFGLFEFLG